MVSDLRGLAGCSAGSASRTASRALPSIHHDLTNARSIVQLIGTRPEIADFRLLIADLLIVDCRLLIVCMHTSHLLGPEYPFVFKSAIGNRQSAIAMTRKARTYTISAVADQYGIHPQTLRLYEREGLLKPSRSEGNTRLYTDPDLERLELILSLTRDLGVNLAGVEIILNMREKMDAMQQEFERFFQYLQTHAEELTNFETPPEGTTDALVPLTRSSVLRRRARS